MAFSRLMYFTVLVLASHVMLSDAAVTVSQLYARNLPNEAPGNQADAYVEVTCSGYHLRTRTIKGTANPNWSEVLKFPSCGSQPVLIVTVYDEDPIGAHDRLGGCEYHLVKGSGSKSCSLTKGTLYFNYSVY